MSTYYFTSYYIYSYFNLINIQVKLELNIIRKSAEFEVKLASTGCVPLFYELSLKHLTWIYLKTCVEVGVLNEE